MPEFATADPLPYATGDLIRRRNVAARLALVISIPIPLLLVILSRIPAGYWVDNRIFHEQNVWYAVLGASALTLALSITGLWLAAHRNAGRQLTATTALVLAILNPILAGACGFPAPRHKHYSYVSCANNLRNIGILLAINTKPDGLLQDDLKAAFAVNQLSEHELVCPLSGDPPVANMTREERAATAGSPNHISYLYFGRGLRKQDLTPNHVLACDKPHNHDRGQYDLWVLYGDFSVRRMPRPQLEKLLPELESGHNPPRSEKLR